MTDSEANAEPARSDATGRPLTVVAASPSLARPPSLASPSSVVAHRLAEIPHHIRVPVAVFLFSVLTALGAYAAIPLGFTPVPMTLQTLFVLLAGAVLGPVAGASSQLLYLGLGLMGMPVFAMGGAGLAWVFGPTGGYLMSFPMAALLVGWIAGRECTRIRTAIALVVGTGAIFALGASWLSVGMDGTGAEIFASAVQPFLPGAAVKAAIAFIVIRQVLARGRGR